MDSMTVLLGPCLGFLFTISTILFIALFAHKTERPEVVATWYGSMEPPPGSSPVAPSADPLPPKE